MRVGRIVPPESLRKKIINLVHNYTKLGINRTKEMVRRTYRFPGMNTRIEDVTQF